MIAYTKPITVSQSKKRRQTTACLFINLHSPNLNCPGPIFY